MPFRPLHAAFFRHVRHALAYPYIWRYPISIPSMALSNPPGLRRLRSRLLQPSLQLSVLQGTHAPDLGNDRMDRAHQAASARQLRSRGL